MRPPPSLPDKAAALTHHAGPPSASVPTEPPPGSTTAKDAIRTRLAHSGTIPPPAPIPPPPAPAAATQTSSSNTTEDAVDLLFARLGAAPAPTPVQPPPAPVTAASGPPTAPRLNFLPRPTTSRPPTPHRRPRTASPSGSATTLPPTKRGRSVLPTVVRALPARENRGIQTSPPPSRPVIRTMTTQTSPLLGLTEEQGTQADAPPGRPAAREPWPRKLRGYLGAPS
ncbi:uncharacterized protein LOC128882752 [Hylaeus volcanicus]|uniref:uncharacterized protein LOC128882752 n=1 Tax=Hylaeus volcanicus TaxID=313075 RepID=UPI0023B7FE03|nr:uncharacterized protein LOC128882752 [Hylaeus volcanicus]